MTTSKTKTIFYADSILLKKIERFQHKYGFSSKSKAIAWLVSWALSQRPIPPPQNDEEYYD